jgi:hypothetical protein
MDRFGRLLACGALGATLLILAGCPSAGSQATATSEEESRFRNPVKEPPPEAGNIGGPPGGGGAAPGGVPSDPNERP